MEILAAKKLSDTDLTAALYKAIASERSNIAVSIACLIEITARDLHTRLGASSLFVYLTRDLKLSESSASKRCAAVRAIRQFPEMLDLVQSSRLHLANISLISRHLTRENSVRLISLAQTQTQRGLEKTLALEFPQRAKRDTIRPVVYSLQRHQSPVDDRENLQKNILPNVHENNLGNDNVRGNEVGRATEVFEAEGSAFLIESDAGPAAGSASGVRPGVTQRVLGARLHVTLNPDAAADLEFLVQAMPGKSPSDILSLALNELRKRRELNKHRDLNKVRELNKHRELNKSRKLAAGKSPSAPPSKCSTGAKADSEIFDVAPVSAAAAAVAKDCARPQEDGTTRMPKVSLVSRTPRFSLASRYIPVGLRREVARRDGHRCTYAAPTSRRCEAIHRLEFDHVNPRAFGGQNTLANLRMLCRAHNNLAAKDLMGKEFIESLYGHG